MIELTRRYTFPAAHRLARPELGQAENQRIFGKCANPAGHGHDYTLEVTVTGEVAEATGQIIELERLDDIFEAAIGRHWSHRMLNEVEPFGGLVPTAENIARVAHDELAVAVAERSQARVTRVRVIETPRNHAMYGETR